VISAVEVLAVIFNLLGEIWPFNFRFTNYPAGRF